MESIHHWKAWNTGQSALFKQKRPNIKWEKWSCGLKQRDSLLKFFKMPSDLVIKHFISFEGGFTSFSLEVSTVMGWSCVFYNLHMQLLCAMGSHQEPVSRVRDGTAWGSRAKHSKKKREEEKSHLCPPVFPLSALAYWQKLISIGRELHCLQRNPLGFIDL